MIYLIIIFLLIFLFLGIFVKKIGCKSSSPEYGKIVEILNGPGLYAFNIIGESHYQEALSIICGGKNIDGHRKIIKANLIRDDQNPYEGQTSINDDAFRIEINGLTVGYMPQELARKFRKRMKEAGFSGLNAKCSSMIVGGWDRGNGEEGYFGVKLDLPKFEKAK